jgi:ACS family D-galactonate transporter-like MFS transporter
VGLLGCRIGVGAFESPALPANVRCVTTWFPAHERAFAIGLYTAMQYATPAVLTPVLAWILVGYGWREIFYATGLAGLVAAGVWYAFYRDPRTTDAPGAVAANEKPVPFFLAARQILAHRQVWGMFIGQFSVQTTLFFFLTWFPAYLINGKGMTILKGGLYAAVPFIAAVIGTLIAGKWSDSMVRGAWARHARKVPIITGFALSAAIMGANYTPSIELVLVFMSIAFFGQAMASTVTGALLSDIAPHRAIGTLGGLLYFVANLGGTSAPIIIGYMVSGTGEFSQALVYVSVVAMAGVLSYLFVMGPTYRIELKTGRPNRQGDSTFG